MKRFIFFMVLLWFALLQIATIFCSAETLSKKKSFSFIGFDVEKNASSFLFTRPTSSIDQNALQITPDNENQDNGYNNKSGRVMYREPYKLWSSDRPDDAIASFNTYFVINMYRKDGWESGEGLAFLIAPSHHVPVGSHGQWMGLTNVTTDGKPENRIVAIEFDTRQQGFDPDSNHIGLNINSVNSTKTVPLSKFGIELSPLPTTNNSVWIHYNGESKVIEVYMVKEGDNKPETPLLKETIDLRHFVEQVSYFGFAGSTGDPGVQFNCVTQWKFEVEVFPSKKDWKWLIIGFSVGVPLMVLVMVLCGIKIRGFCLKKKKRARDEEAGVTGKLKMLPGMPKEFKYKDLKRATKNFHESMILGKGGFGVVYRGVLISDAVVTQVAVKKFSRDNIDGKEDFLAELTIINLLRHKNLVRLEGM